MSVEQNKQPEEFDPTTQEGREKARRIFKDEIEKNGFPSHQVIKITDTFYTLLKKAKEDQMEFLVGIAFAMFNNAKQVWIQRRMSKSGLITPESKGIIKPGGG